MPPLQVELVKSRNKHHHHFLSALHKKYKNISAGAISGIIFVAALVVVAIVFMFKPMFENFGGTQGKLNIAFPTASPSMSTILQQTNAAGTMTGWNFIPASNYSGQMTLQYYLTPTDPTNTSALYTQTQYPNYVTLNIAKTYNQMTTQSPFPASMYPVPQTTITDQSAYIFTNQNLLDMTPLIVDDLNTTETHVSYVGYSTIPDPVQCYTTIPPNSPTVLTNNAAEILNPGQTYTAIPQAATYNELVQWTFKPPLGFVGTVIIYYWLTNTGDISYANVPQSSGSTTSTLSNGTTVYTSSTQANPFATSSLAPNQSMLKFQFSFTVSHQYLPPIVVPVQLGTLENTMVTIAPSSLINQAGVYDKYVLPALSWNVSSPTLIPSLPPYITQPPGNFTISNGNYNLKFNGTNMYLLMQSAPYVSPIGTIWPGANVINNNLRIMQFTATSNGVATPYRFDKDTATGAYYIKYQYLPGYYVNLAAFQGNLVWIPSSTSPSSLKPNPTMADGSTSDAIEFVISPSAAGSNYVIILANIVANASLIPLNIGATFVADASNYDATAYWSISTT